MSNQFTPGPWTLKTVLTSIGSCHTVGPFPSAGSRKETNACIYADGFRTDEREGIAGELYANARLIAAAPALYEAAIKIERWFAERNILGGSAPFLVADLRAALALVDAVSPETCINGAAVACDACGVAPGKPHDDGCVGGTQEWVTFEKGPQ